MLNRPEPDHPDAMEARGVAGHLARRPQPDPHALSPWLSSSGNVSHPDAPLGAGGEGFFRAGGPINQESSLYVPAHPHSPDGPRKLLSPTDATIVRLSHEEDQAVAAYEEETPPNPAPVVTRETWVLVKFTPPPTGLQVDITVRCKVLVDREDSTLDSNGETFFEGSRVRYQGPTFDAHPDDSELLGRQTRPFRVFGEFTVGTKYKRLSDRDGPSAYGRGTTKEDKAAGNTTLGFHEHCHRTDIFNWVLSQNIPMLSVGPGDSFDELGIEMELYQERLLGYVSQANLDTETRTDDVGDPTKDEYLRGLEEGGGDDES